ncbi:MAG: murein L,D-transpeptidase catalytic domain-containing protein [Bacteriovoracia bacterium]
MIQRLFILTSLLVALAISLGVAQAAPARYPIKVKVSVSGAESTTVYIIPPEKKYSLSVNNSEQKRTKIALYDKDGNKKEGLYWIANADLEKVMRKPIADVLTTLQNRPTAAPCANCGVDDAQNRPEPTAEPANAPAPASVSSSANPLCNRFHEFVKKGVPEAPLKQALLYYSRFKKKFAGNDRYISIADYSQRSNKKRFYMLDLKTGELMNEKVSHGSGMSRGRIVSDPNNDGMVDRCEHPDRVLAAKRNPRRAYKTRENMTRPGFFATGSLNLSVAHARKWPRVTSRTNSLLLNGLSGKINGSARQDGVFMHETYYNFDGPGLMGKTFGCPGFVQRKGTPIFKKIVGGSLYYSYVPVCKDDMDYVLQDIKDWDKFCEE